MADAGLVSDKAHFHAMTEGSRDQWMAIASADASFERGLPQWILQNMTLLRSDNHAFAVDRLEHCLQAGTRALRDGRDEEYVVCALLHDMGATLAPKSHGMFAAMILQPYVSQENCWMLSYHSVFQQYYFAHFFGGNRHAREKLRDHPCYRQTIDFCHLYDQCAFDPGYASLQLADFAPMLGRVLSVRKTG